MLNNAKKWAGRAIIALAQESIREENEKANKVAFGILGSLAALAAGAVALGWAADVNEKLELLEPIIDAQRKAEAREQHIEEARELLESIEQAKSVVAEADLEEEVERAVKAARADMRAAIVAKRKAARKGNDKGIEAKA